jgi:hypothetical protein
MLQSVTPLEQAMTFLFFRKWLKIVSSAFLLLFYALSEVELVRIARFLGYFTFAKLKFLCLKDRFFQLGRDLFSSIKQCYCSLASMEIDSARCINEVSGKPPKPHSLVFFCTRREYSGGHRQVVCNGSNRKKHGVFRRFFRWWKVKPHVYQDFLPVIFHCLLIGIQHPDRLFETDRFFLHDRFDSFFIFSQVGHDRTLIPNHLVFFSITHINQCISILFFLP